jgi:hypothetical protein
MIINLKVDRNLMPFENVLIIQDGITGADYVGNLLNPLVVKILKDYLGDVKKGRIWRVL